MNQCALSKRGSLNVRTPLSNEVRWIYWTNTYKQPTAGKVRYRSTLTKLMGFRNVTYSPTSLPMRHVHKSLCLGGHNGDSVLLQLRPNGVWGLFGGCNRSRFQHSQVNSNLQQARQCVLQTLLLVWLSYVSIARKT